MTAADCDLDRAVTVLLAIFWAASVARVWIAAAAREVFGAEASVAFVSVFLLPWLAARAWVRARRSRHFREPSRKRQRLAT